MRGRPCPRSARRSPKSEPVFESVALVPLRSAERVLALALLYYRPHLALPTPGTLDHVGFLGRVLAGPLEAAAAREATASADRMRAVSHASASAMASLLTRLPAGSARRATLPIEDVLAPLRVPGVTVTVVRRARRPSTATPRSCATRWRRSSPGARRRPWSSSMIPVIGVYAGLEEGFVRVHVWLGEGAAVVGGPVVTQDVHAPTPTRR